MDDYSRMAALCSRREYCSYDISEKLRKRGLEEGEIEAVLNKLTSERFVDDRRYARAYANEKMRLAGWGEKKVEFALKKKRIPSPVIAEAIAEILEEQPGMLGENLDRLLKGKFDSIARKYDFSNLADKNRCKASLLRYALSRGYSYAEIIGRVERFF